MTQTSAKLKESSTEKPRPGFWEQVVFTLKILLATGAVLGGLWVLDTMVS